MTVYTIETPEVAEANLGYAVTIYRENDDGDMKVVVVAMFEHLHEAQASAKRWDDVPGAKPRIQHREGSFWMAVDG